MNHAAPWWRDLAPLLAEHDSQSIEREAKQLRGKANDATDAQLAAWALIARQLVKELDLPAARLAVKGVGVRRQKLANEVARLERLQQDHQHAAQLAYQDARQRTGIGKAKRQAREAALAEMHSFREQARDADIERRKLDSQLYQLHDPAHLEPWVESNRRVLALGLAAEWVRDAPERAVRHLLGSPTLAHVAAPLVDRHGNFDLDGIVAAAQTNTQRLLLALAEWLSADHHENSPPISTLSHLDGADLQRALEAIAIAHRIAKLAPEEADTGWLDTERAVRRRVHVISRNPPPDPPAPSG